MDVDTYFTGVHTAKNKTTKKMHFRHIGLALALFLLGATALPAAAQPTWIEGTSGGPQVSLDWTKPSFEGGEVFGDVSTGFFTSRLLLSGQYPVTERLRLVADLPVGRFKIDEDEVETSEDVSLGSTEVGNPYLGIEGKTGTAVTVGGGIRLPLASTEDDPGGGEDTDPILQALALLTGSIADIGRLEAFSEKTFTARSYGHYTFRSPQGMNLRLRGGLSLLVPTEDTDRRENIVLVDYGGRAWYGGDRLRVGAGLGGRTNLNADEEESFDERSVYFLDATVQVRFGQMRPGAVVRVPLSDEPSDVLGYAAGLSVSVAL